jgi:hypothetical protein
VDGSTSRHTPPSLPERDSLPKRKSQEICADIENNEPSKEATSMPFSSTAILSTTNDKLSSNQKSTSLPLPCRPGPPLRSPLQSPSPSLLPSLAGASHSENPTYVDLSTLPPREDTNVQSPSEKNEYLSVDLLSSVSSPPQQKTTESTTVSSPSQTVTSQINSDTITTSIATNSELHQTEQASQAVRVQYGILPPESTQPASAQ